jgi:hypothetical protein
MHSGILSGDRRGAALRAAAALACVFVSGCEHKNLPVTPDLAKQSLEAALESWKRGESPEALAARTPPVTVGDFAWREGRKLTDFRVVGEPRNAGFNVSIDVELTFGDAKGAAAEQATYVVGTDPTITIFRE